MLEKKPLINKEFKKISLVLLHLKYSYYSIWSYGVYLMKYDDL